MQYPYLKHIFVIYIFLYQEKLRVYTVTINNQIVSIERKLYYIPMSKPSYTTP